MNDIICYNVEIQAILFGVNEKILDVNFIDGYDVKKVSLIPHKSNLDKMYDVGSFELRRKFEAAVIDDQLNVPCIFKNMYMEISKGKEFTEGYRKVISRELNTLDGQVRAVRLLTESPIRFKEFVFKAYPKANNNNSNIDSKVPNREGLVSMGGNSNLSDNDIDFINKNLKSVTFPFLDVIKNQCHMFYDLSYHQLTNASSLLLLHICLEMQFILNERNGLGKTISKRCSNYIGVNQQDKDNIFENISELYKKRNKYVHKGVSEEISRDDVVLLRSYVRKSILKWLGDSCSKVELIKDIEGKL